MFVYKHTEKKIEYAKNYPIFKKNTNLWVYNWKFIRIKNAKFPRYDF